MYVEKSNLKYVSAVLAGLVFLGQALAFPVSAGADAISPQIKDNGDVYSEERPNKALYGSGIAGRLTEASRLRFHGEQDTIEGRYDLAIKRLSKAVQLDPGYPAGHVLLAKALTGKLKRSEEVDEKLLSRCVYEWTLIKRHDADLLHQSEAKSQLRSLRRLVKSIKKQKKLAREKEGDSNESRRSLLSGRGIFGWFR